MIHPALNWKPLARQPKQLIPMQTTVMIIAKMVSKRILIGVVFPNFRPIMTPQAIPAAAPRKTATVDGASLGFTPHKTVRIVSTTGASEKQIRSGHLALAGSV